MRDEQLKAFSARLAALQANDTAIRARIAAMRQEREGDGGNMADETHDTNERTGLTEARLDEMESLAIRISAEMLARGLPKAQAGIDMQALLADDRRLRAVVMRQAQQLAQARAALQRMVDRGPFRRTDCSGYRVCDFCYADEDEPHVFGCQWVADRALLTTLGVERMEGASDHAD